MKKTLFLLPALALSLFPACSGEEALTSENKTQQTTQDDAVAFDAYINRTVTRAGAPGAITSDVLKANTSSGFGVFAYYSNGELYSENAIPDFMYNQQVTYDGSNWTYSPLKYWPNEFGSSAVSTGVDRVTFFAYAPYVGVDPTTGQLTSFYDDSDGHPELSTETGITALTRNGKTGDPYVRYVGAFEPDKCVDLLYGVAAENFKSYVGAADGANDIKEGEPFIDVAKPEIGAKLKFNFQHALAKLTVNVDADVNIVDHSEGDALDANTRIWIRSITFSGISERGYLNLHSGLWYEVMGGNKISHASVTVHDGLRDGAEPIATDEFEAPTGINPALIQSDKYYVTPTTDATLGTPKYDLGNTEYASLTKTDGVTATSQSLFGGSNALMVIPANEQVKVTIVYDVETVDATLPTYLSDGETKGSTIENRITKNITLGGTALKLESGKAYTLNLHLGMTSVKFDAQVADWDASNTADDTWLPINGPTYTASSSATAATTISAEAQTFKFAIAGLNANEAVTAPTGLDSHLSNATGNAANASGLAVETIDIAANTTVSDRTSTVTWTGATSGKGVALTITQKAHELGLGVSAVDGSAKTITLSKNASDEWSGIITDATNTNNLLVKKNGTALVESTNFTYSNGAITLTDAPVPGDVFTITVKAGDADAETVTARIGGPVLSNATQSIEYGETYTRTPVFIGPATPTYSWSSSVDATATVNALGEVTSVAVNSGTASTITLTATASNADGWFYDTTAKTYNVTVSQTNGSISYEGATVTDQAIAASQAVGTYTAVLKNSKGTDITTGGGTIAYSITSQKLGDNNVTNFTVDPSTGALTIITALENSKTYTVVLRATVTGNDNAAYATTTADATITITTVAAP